MRAPRRKKMGLFIAGFVAFALADQAIFTSPGGQPESEFSRSVPLELKYLRQKLLLLTPLVVVAHPGPRAANHADIAIVCGGSMC